MGKFKRKIVPTAEGIKRRQEQEQEAARQKQIAETERVQAHMKERKEKRIAGIVFFSASVFLFVLATVFFAIDLFRMHAYETEYTRVTGTVIDIELRRIGMERNYYLVISYSFGGSDYILHDTDPIAGSRFDLIGTKTELFVLPSNPILAITVSTSGRSSVIGAVLFAIGAFAFTIAIRFLFGSYKKRLLCAYLPLFLAAIAYLCLFVVAFPNGGLGAVFARMDGAVGYAVAAGYALAAALLDGILSKIIKKIFGMKKKKRKQSECERAFQEDAAQAREQKRLARIKNERKTALAMLLLACAFFAVFLVFFCLNTAKMRNYELNYIRTYGVVTGFQRHDNAAAGKFDYYTPIFSYSYGGKQYTATDWAAYPAPEEDLIGKNIEIYVDLSNPEKAARTVTADGFSVMAAVPFAIALIPLLIGGALLVSLKGGGFKMRILCVWLPAAILCMAFVLLFALGLPNEGIAEVYSRIAGATWLTVFAGIVIAIGIIDGLIVLKYRPSEIDSRAKAWKKIKK